MPPSASFRAPPSVPANFPPCAAAPDSPPECPPLLSAFPPVAEPWKDRSDEHAPGVKERQSSPNPHDIPARLMTRVFPCALWEVNRCQNDAYSGSFRGIAAWLSRGTTRVTAWPADMNGALPSRRARREKRGELVRTRQRIRGGSCRTHRRRAGRDTRFARDRARQPC